VDRRGWELPITVPWYSCTTNNTTDYSSIMASATNKNDYNLTNFLVSHIIYKTTFYYCFFNWNLGKGTNRFNCLIYGKRALLLLILSKYKYFLKILWCYITVLVFNKQLCGGIHRHTFLYTWLRYKWRQKPDVGVTYKVWRRFIPFFVCVKNPERWHQVVWQKNT